jgi:hypothetical protein
VTELGTEAAAASVLMSVTGRAEKVLPVRETVAVGIVVPSTIEATPKLIVRASKCRDSSGSKTSRREPSLAWKRREAQARCDTEAAPENERW